MGHNIEVRRSDTGREIRDPGGFDVQIGTLIGQLEGLLDERRQYGGRDRIGLNPGTIAGMPCTAPDRRATSPVVPKHFPNGRAALARDLIRQRRLRSSFLPEAFFAEPAWDMLLDLYAAHYENKPVSVSSLCIAADVPSTTALRSIEMMAEQGCLVRRRDPSDGRRIFIALSDATRKRIDAYFDNVDG